MKFRVDIHPINTALLDKLDINHSSLLKNNQRYAGVISKLIKAGYIEMHSEYLPEHDEVRTHMTKAQDENGNYIKELPPILKPQNA